MEKIIDRSFINIGFVKRFENLVSVYNNFSNRLTKVDNKFVKQLFKILGYNVKVFNPGGDFYLFELNGDFRFEFWVNKKGGALIVHIYIFNNDNKIGYESNTFFIYRRLIDNMELLIDPIVFANENEFESILKEFLSIYEDFKAEFLKQIEEQKR